MRAILGLLLVMIGLAMAIVWMPDHGGDRQLAVVTDFVGKGVERQPAAVNVAPSAARSGRTFSPQTPLLATVEPSATRLAAPSVSMARVATPVTEVPPPATVVRPSVVPSVVTSAPAASVVSGVVAGAAPAVLEPEMSRDDLVRSLQRELKRVGCYAGDVDGDWGSGSRRAMIAFTERVNASLPVDQPDFVLLTLIRGQSSSVCGKDCPAGQSAASNGRCVPNAVVAQSRRPAERRTAAVTSPTETVAVTPPPVAQPAPLQDGQPWQFRVTRGPATEVDPAMRPAAAVAAAAVVAPPLPGRMSIGATQPAAPEIHQPPSPAQNAVRAVGQGGPVAVDDGPRRSAGTRRDRSRRDARRAGPAVAGYRYPPVVVYRAPPRYAAPPAYYASAPRRSRSRSWTATFFGTP